MSGGVTAEAVARARAAIAAILAGEPVVVIDPADRPDRGELVMAASAADVTAINFLLGAARGLPALALPGERVERLCPAAGGDGPLFVDAVVGIGSGLSAHDRARTIAAAADPGSGSGALRPRGHVLLLPARPGGVLAHAGRAEIACDLARLAGRGPAGVTCEVLTADGSEATSEELRALAAERRLPHLEAGDLVAYRRRHDLPIALVDERPLDTAFGRFRLSVWSTVDEPPHVAVVCGAPAGSGPVLVRMHSECLTGDVLGSLRCDCGSQLAAALAAIAEEGAGVLLYLPQEGRGIGILDKLRAYALQDQGLDTVDANLALGHPVDNRDYAGAAALLRRLGIRQVRLLTNNPAKVAALIDLGMDVQERVPLEIPPNTHNRAYLAAKQARMGHLLHAAGTAAA